MNGLWTINALRAFEEEIKATYLTGKIRGAIHLRRGGEKQLIDIFQEIGPLDWCFGTYRAHLHCLLKGVPLGLVKTAIEAGHSMHLEFPLHKFFTSAIVGGILSIATGTALGLKRSGQDGQVFVFVGDMASLGGTFHECSKYARGFGLPITFIIECNEYSTNSPTYPTWGMEHNHNVDGTVASIDQWEGGGIKKYCYDREGWPHVGAGQWVDFDQAEKAQAGERPDVMA